MFSKDWSTSKSKALLAALPVLAAATSIALNIVVLAFVIQLESKIDNARMGAWINASSEASDPLAVALGDMQGDLGGENSVNDSSEVDLMAGELFEVQVGTED